MGETSRAARCHRSPIPQERTRPTSVPRLIKVILALCVVGGVGTSLGVTSMEPAAASPSPDAVRAEPSLGVQTVPGTGSLNGVACNTPSSCVAVGSVNGEGVVVPIDDGVPGSPQAIGGIDTLTSVTCTGAHTCLAVGTEPYTVPPGRMTTVGAVVDIVNGQAVNGAPIVGNDLPGTLDAVFPSGVGCSGTTLCIAVGSSTFEAGFGVDVGGEGAGVVQSISPLPINGVECAKDDWCVADGQSFAEFVRIVKGHFRRASTVGFPNKTNLNSGACHALSVEFCAVAGVDGRNAGEGAVFSVVGESAGLMRDVPGTSTLNDLACSGDYWCVAVGQSTAGGGAIVPVGWETPGAVRPVTGIDGFDSVSCPTQQFCVAVGVEGSGGASTGILDTFPIWG